MRHYNPATHCNTLQSTANTYITWKEEIHRKDSSSRTEILQHCATHCNTLQHSATLCNTLQHTATMYIWPGERESTGRIPPAGPSGLAAVRICCVYVYVFLWVYAWVWRYIHIAAVQMRWFELCVYLLVNVRARECTQKCIFTHEILSHSENLCISEQIIF